MTSWIQIKADDGVNVTVLPTDTDEEIREAQAALRDAGIKQSPVFVGDPDSPDCYETTLRVFAK